MKKNKLILTLLYLFFQNCALAQQTQISFVAANDNQTFTTCSAFMIDSGGSGGPGYSNNETVTVTICPGNPGDQVSVTFNTFSLNSTDDNPSPTVTNVDKMEVFDGPNTSANTLGTYSGAQLLGVVIQATPQNVNGCITFRFTSNSVGTGMFTASATCATPCSDPIAKAKILNGITDDSIRVCVGEQVSFSDNGSLAQNGFNLVSYKWDFMDGNSATGPNVDHSFQIPGLYRVQLFVRDDNDDNVCENNNLVDLQVLVGTIPTFEGFPHDTTLCIGESLNLVTDPDSYEVEWSGFPSSSSIDDGCLTDSQLGVAQNIDLTQTGFLAGTTITNVNQISSICIDLEHSYMGDLVISVKCPNGQQAILHQQGGGGTLLGEPNQEDNVDCAEPATLGVPYSYCFTATATQTWAQWAASQTGFALTLPTGNYAPVQALTNLVGCPTNGVWTISVVDNWASDDGTLFAFALNLDPSMYPDVQTFEPQIGVAADSSFWNMPATFSSNLSANSDNMTLTPTTPGTYQYVYTVKDDFGCTFDSTFTMKVNPDVTVSLGNDTLLCDATNLKLNPVVNGVPANSFCDYTLEMNSLLGNGWNGNTITVSANGVNTNYTFNSGATSSVTLHIPSTASVTVTFNNEGFNGNFNGYNITDGNGQVVVNHDFDLFGVTTDNFTANCHGDFTYDWTPVNLVSNAAILNPTITPPVGTSIVTFTVTPTGHPLCAISDQISINLSLRPDAGRDTTLQICAAAPAFDLFTLLPGADLGGVWTNGAGTVVQMPYDIAVSGAGVFKYTVTNVNDCSDFALVTITSKNTTITNLVVNDVNCHSKDNGDIKLVGTNILSYKLNGGPLVNAVSPVIITNLSPRNYLLELNGPTGCFATTNFTIKEPEALRITNVNQDVTICKGSSVSLSAQGAGGSTTYGYTWYENWQQIGIQQSQTVTPVVSPSQYCIVFSEQCGSPADTMCLNVKFYDDVKPLITPSVKTGCAPLYVIFTNTTTPAASVQTMEIDFGDGTVKNFDGNGVITHIFKQVKQYDIKLKIKTINGCVFDTLFTSFIETYPIPDASFTVSPEVVSMFNPEASLVNTSSSDAIIFTWKTPKGTVTSQHSAHSYVKYPADSIAVYPITLIVENANHCVDSVTNYLEVKSDVLLYAPNSFTPDGDPFNQVWSIYMSGIDSTGFSLKLFNRWGENVWESKDVKASWDGTYKGQKVPPGVYTWLIQATDIKTDQRYSYHGSVHVLK